MHVFAPKVPSLKTWDRAVTAVAIEARLDVTAVKRLILVRIRAGFHPTIVGRSSI